MAFFKYFFIRAGIFVPLFVIFMLLQIGPYLAIIFAAIIAFCVSYLFFRKQRDAAVDAMRYRFSGKAKPMRTATERSDADIEDSMVDTNADVGISMDGQHRSGSVRIPIAEVGGIPKEFLDS